MQRQSSGKAPGKERVLLIVLVLLGCGSGGEPTVSQGGLVLSIVDRSSGAPTPARIELVGEGGDALVPAGALLLPRGECLEVALPDWLRPTAEVGEIENRYTGTRQFYVDGMLETELPPGRYHLRAFKGIEFRVAEDSFEIAAERTASVRLELDRWVDLPARGWWGADEHLHIPRHDPRFDARIATWMRAEGLHVASLLQGGSARRFDIARQHGFGPQHVYRADGILLVSGQEHPRTSLLGHTIVLAPNRAIDRRDAYLRHDLLWAEARRQDGLGGYAHWGLGAGQNGLAMDAPSGGLSFLEVLGFDFAEYAPWYDLLDLGIRLAPTAGSDYPCNPFTHPGRERFYARMEGGLGLGSWKEAIRRGRTFVTNGPIPELRIDGAEIGDSIEIASPRLVEITGTIAFDPQRDRIETVELIRNGRPIEAAVRVVEPGILRIDERLRVDSSTWFALRVAGSKLGEQPPPRGGWVQKLVAKGLPRFQGGAPFADRFAREAPSWPSIAHTAAIFIEVAGSPPVHRRPAARRAARRWLERLEALRARLARDRPAAPETWPVSVGDGVSVDQILRDRDALLAAIDRAAAFYRRGDEP